MTIQPKGKQLKEIDNAIRHHYFEDDCNHENRDKCASHILNRIIGITGYKSRSVLSN